MIIHYVITFEGISLEIYRMSDVIDFEVCLAMKVNISISVTS